MPAAKRTCAVCGADISHRGAAAWLCEVHAAERALANAAARSRRARAAATPRRRCEVCNADISHRGPLAQRCEKHAGEKKRARAGARNVEWFDTSERAAAGGRELLRLRGAGYSLADAYLLVYPDSRATRKSACERASRLIRSARERASTQEVESDAHLQRTT